MFKSDDSIAGRYLVIPALVLIGLLAVGAGQTGANQSPAGDARAAIVPDAELIARASERLAEIDAAGIDLSAHAGEVRLRGEVEDYRAWERVHAAIRDVEGVTRLSSELKIRGRQLIPRPSDREIVAGVEAKLADNRIGPEVKVESRGGAVTLTGRVDSDRARKTAGLLAHSSAGVRTVDNRLQVIAG